MEKAKSATATTELPVDRRFSRFWNAFSPNEPSFREKSVLDIGCGEGRRCIEAAANGASRVVGVDPYPPSIAAARARLEAVPMTERERIVFFEGELPTLPPQKFDLIISEDTLEHVIDVPALLREVKDRLNPGGKFYAGFGPLYHAHDGDHGWMRAVLPARRVFNWPWGHLYLEKYAFARLSQVHGKRVTGTHDWPYLSLNQHTFREFRDMFAQSGLRVSFFRVNRFRSQLKKLVFTALRHVPGWGRYFTVNIYVIFEAV